MTSRTKRGKHQGDFQFCHFGIGDAWGPVGTSIEGCLVCYCPHSEGMGKVLFSQVSVCSHFGGGGAYLPADEGYLPFSHLGVGVPTFQPSGRVLIFQLMGGTYLPAAGGTYLLDREGHGHKAVVYKSHFPPLRHSVVTETPADTLANKPHLHTKTLFVLYSPMTWWQLRFKTLRSQDY